MAKDIFARLHIEVAVTKESDDQSTLSRSHAVREMLRAMSERKYSPDNDPAIKRFEDRLRGIKR